jgi:hypothetical protein
VKVIEHGVVHRSLLKAHLGIVGLGCSNRSVFCLFYVTYSLETEQGTDVIELTEKVQILCNL